jgi:hypothetical protein
MKTYFRITYRDPMTLEIQTLKARSVSDSSLGLSFVAASDFIFNTSSVVVDPSEEQLQKKLEHVKVIHLSLYSILSIEEVGEEHIGLKFENDKSNVLTLPNTPPPSV